MLLAFYDLNCSPASFEILHFLASAQGFAKGDPVHVIIVPGTSKGFRVNDHKPISIAEKEWRLRHVLIPCITAAGMSFTVAPTREFAAGFATTRVFPAGYRVDWPRPDYTCARVLEYIRAGTVPSFKASERATEYVKAKYGDDKIVTLTLRNTYTATRNSNTAAWLDFAVMLAADGYVPVIVPDTADLLAEVPERLDGIADYLPVASTDFDIRLALYDIAVMNCSASGGPFIANILDPTRPYIFFQKAYDKGTVAEGGRKHWQPTKEFYEKMGFPYGTQFPLSGPKRKLFWGDDTYETITDAFAEVMA